MSSYREHGFDPNAYEQPGPPMRPYNWVQWLGVLLGSAGVLLGTADVAGRLGWIDARIDAGTGIIVALCASGVVLINSRRQPGHDIAPELAAARRRWLIVISVVCVVIIGAAIVFELTGAN